MRISGDKSWSIDECSGNRKIMSHLIPPGFNNIDVIMLHSADM